MLAFLQVLGKQCHSQSLGGGGGRRGVSSTELTAVVICGTVNIAILYFHCPVSRRRAFRATHPSISPVNIWIASRFGG